MPVLSCTLDSFGAKGTRKRPKRVQKRAQKVITFWAFWTRPFTVPPTAVDHSKGNQRFWPKQAKTDHLKRGQKSDHFLITFWPFVAVSLVQALDHSNGKWPLLAILPTLGDIICRQLDEQVVNGGEVVARLARAKRVHLETSWDLQKRLKKRCFQTFWWSGGDRAMAQRRGCPQKTGKVKKRAKVALFAHR